MKNFTTGNIAKQIVIFSLPMLVGSMFQQMYGVVDAVVVGRFLGGDALAAVGVSMSAFFFLTAALFGLTTGASVIISQFFGSKQHDKLERAMSTSVLFLAGLAAAITALGVVLTPAILRGLGAPEEIFAQASIYMRIQMGGLVFPIFFNMYTAYLRALGNSRSPLYILMFSTTLNALLNILFVVVLGLGIAAVSVGTVISQGVAAVLCYLYIRKNVPLLRVSKLVFDKQLFVSVLKYGTPAALQLSLVSLAMLTITRLINSFGAAAMAGITAAGRIDQIAILPVSTLSLALSTFVAQNMGAGLEDRARKGLSTTLLYMVLLAAATSAILIITGPWLISMFIDQTDPNVTEILHTGQTYLSIMVIFYFLFAILFAFNGFFRGAGDAVIAMVFPVCSLTIRTLSAYALVYLGGMGPEALAWSIPIGWAVTSLASWVYYRKRLWVGKVVG
jgi:putative MATE family efflux protein